MHQPSRIVEISSTEAALERTRHECSLLPDLLSFPFSLAEHQNIAETDRPLYITSDNASFVASLADSDSDLDDLAGYSGSADYLGYFGGC
jgi:hypothetical protein